MVHGSRNTQTPSFHATSSAPTYAAPSGSGFLSPNWSSYGAAAGNHASTYPCWPSGYAAGLNGYQGSHAVQAWVTVAAGPTPPIFYLQAPTALAAPYPHHRLGCPTYPGPPPMPPLSSATGLPGVAPDSATPRRSRAAKSDRRLAKVHEVARGQRCGVGDFEEGLNLAAARGLTALVAQLLGRRKRLGVAPNDLHDAQCLRAKLCAQPRTITLTCDPVSFQLYTRALANKGNIEGLKTLLDNRGRLNIGPDWLHTGYLLYAEVTRIRSNRTRRYAYDPAQFVSLSRALANAGEVGMLLQLRDKWSYLRLPDSACRRGHGEILRALVLTKQLSRAITVFRDELQSSRRVEVLLPFLASLIEVNNRHTAGLIYQQPLTELVTQLRIAEEHKAADILHATLL